MRAILARDQIDAWLSGMAEQAYNVLGAYSTQLMVAWPVSKSVNSPRNNSATLTELRAKEQPKDQGET